MAHPAKLDYTHRQAYTENNTMSPTRPRIATSFIMVVMAFGLMSIAVSEEVALKPGHPERYTVQVGDTLWDIAARFLRSPWHWPKVWKINEQIKNPHLIYPGDVLLLRYVDGKPEISVLRREKLEPGTPLSEAPPEARAVEEPAAPPPDGRTVKLKPRIYSEALDEAIPTIPPNAILPFLTEPFALSDDELRDAAYVTVGLDDRLALGDHSEFYARGFEGPEHEFYQVVRPGKALRHPESGELLGFDTAYLGEAQRFDGKDPVKLIVSSAKQEIGPKDRLVPAPKKAALPFYQPHAPKSDVRGWILSSPNAVAEVGQFAVVAVSLGARDGIEDGHVLRIMRHVGSHRDPVTGGRYELPEEDSGLAMVFRTFEKLSYALVMTATRPVHIGDAVITP
jgi:LysM repeat protein